MLLCKFRLHCLIFYYFLTRLSFVTCLQYCELMGNLFSLNCWTPKTSQSLRRFFDITSSRTFPENVLQTQNIQRYAQIQPTSVYMLEPFVKLVVMKTHLQYEHIFFRKSIESKIFAARSIHICPKDTWSKITWTDIPFYFSYWILLICFHLALFLDNPFHQRFQFLRWNIWMPQEKSASW